VNASYPISASLIDRGGNTVTGTPAFSTTTAAVQVSSGGVVQGKSIGRGRIGIQIGAFADSAVASVVPQGTLAFFDMGQFVGDSMRFASAGLDGSGYQSIVTNGVTPNMYSPSNDMAPRWKAATSELVHTRLVNGVPRIFAAGTGGSLRRVISQPSSPLGEAEPDYSPTDGWIYYVGTDTLGLHAIWRVQSAGGTPEQVSDSSDGLDFRSPSASPDGSALAYVSRFYPWEQYHGFVRNLSTGVVTPLGTNEAAGTVWSPAGNWILYAVSGSFAGYSGQLHVIHPDGTGDKLLIDSAYYPGGTWSPDGAFVVGVRAEIPYTGFELIDVAAGTRLPLVYPNASWYGPSWVQ
jgi:Tol biopolymer transport system component